MSCELTRAQRRALESATAHGPVTRQQCRAATLAALEALGLLEQHYHHDYEWTITVAGRHALRRTP